MAYEDIGKLKLTSHVLIHKTKYKKNWEYKIEIPGTPEHFEFYVKDFGVTDISVETESEKAGGLTITMPSGLACVQINMVMRDDSDEKISKFMKDWAAMAVNNDGTFNLPSHYCKDITRYKIISKGSIEKVGAIYEKVYPTIVGETQFSVDGGMMEFPVQLTQFMAQTGVWNNS